MNCGSPDLRSLKRNRTFCRCVLPPAENAKRERVHYVARRRRIIILMALHLDGAAS